jgi:hypothetical protein
MTGRMPWRGAAAGRTGLVAIGLSVLATFAVAVAGPSVMEPVLPGRAGQPPWAFDLHLSPYLAVGLTAFGLAAGTAGLVLALRAVRGGWSVSARAVLLAGIVAAAVLTLVPPFGSSDPLSYAAYGRMVATGHNPYLTTPAQLAALGDPVARAVQDWFTQPSVYGPLASGIQGLAALIGGTSARLTVFVLGLANLVAFVVTALLLYRMTSGRPDRQLRAALLWAANPLLLQVLVAGAHVDGQAIACCVAAAAVMYGPWGPGSRVAGSTPVRAAGAGALVGAGFAIKVTAALVGLGFAIALVLALWGNWRRLAPLLAALAAGFAVVAGAAVAIGGSAMLKTTSQASGMVSIGSPWRVIRTALQHTTGYGSAGDIVKYGAIALAVVLAVLLARGGRGVWGDAIPSAGGVRGDGSPRERSGSPGGRPPGEILLPLALVLGWLFAWPYVLPWYDALGWALLALVPASDVDWLLLARTAALGFAYLPARTADVTLPHGLDWLQPVFRHGVAPVVLTVATAWLVVLMWRAGPAPSVVTGHDDGKGILAGRRGVRSDHPE